MAGLIDIGMTFHGQGKLGDAERAYKTALQQDPNHFDAIHLLGLVKLQQGDFGAARELLSRAVAMRPRSIDALCNLSAALLGLGRNDEVVGVCDRALAIDPADVQSNCNRGNALFALRRIPEALASYDRVLAVKPSHVNALFNRGSCLASLQQFEDARATFDKLIAVAPRHEAGFNNRGNTLLKLGRLDEALASYDAALVVQPEEPAFMRNRGNALVKLARFDEALAAFDQAVAFTPEPIETLAVRGEALRRLGRNQDAIEVYDRILSQYPGDYDALVNRADNLLDLGQLPQAAEGYEQAMQLRPDRVEAPCRRAIMMATICDWAEAGASPIVAAVERESPIEPFMTLQVETTAKIQLAAARTWVQSSYPRAPAREWTAASFATDRLRVAYLSADFRQHAIAHLMAELLELHDRRHFEIIGISFGPDDGSALRSRVIKAFDRFVDVRAISDVDAAKLIGDLGTHIAVDLMGHTLDGRPRIFAQRAAPIQVGYLGYSATTGADFIDYVIADPIVLPFDQAPFYTEKIVHLPDSYQVNDRKRSVGPRPSRVDVGLPEKAFVFSCFNNNWKLNRRMFHIWMRLLAAVEGSVLWLFQMHAAAAWNLRQEAMAQGIDPDRLVFAQPVPAIEGHMARVALADLFLDTLPYNAHTTASDSLWMGVPVLTCMGDTFAGRVAASLLHAVGLPELVTRSLDDYETLALRLATDPARLQAIRGKLAEQRLSCALFDTDRFRRHIEAAYTTMWETWRRGEGPRSFAVDAI